MGTEITQSSIAERVTDRIRSEFVNLISDEEWNLLVAGELERFTTPDQSKGPDYNRRVVPGPLRALIREALETEAKKRIGESIVDVAWPTADGEDLVRRMVLECSNEIMANAFSAMVTDALQRFKMQLEQEAQNRQVY